MLSPCHRIYVPDEIIQKCMDENLLLFGVETSKATDYEHFGRMLDNRIDKCFLAMLDNATTSWVEELENLPAPIHIQKVMKAVRNLKRVVNDRKSEGG